VQKGKRSHCRVTSLIGVPAIQVSHNKCNTWMDLCNENHSYVNGLNRSSIHPFCNNISVIMLVLAHSSASNWPRRELELI